MSDHKDDHPSEKMAQTGRDPAGRWLALFAGGAACLLAIVIIYMVLFDNERAIDVEPPTVEEAQ